MESAFFACCFLFLTIGWTQGRVVKVPKGPLVRVQGQGASIRCTVSSYQGPREQDFEWKVMRDNGEIQLVSTFDLSYSDRSLQDRVDSGDISMERLGDDSVELRIRSLRASDSAIYRCSTPSTDSVISGNYVADVRLKVIPDSLKLSPVAPPAVVPEGTPIALRCTATVASAEPTSLSITWSIREGTSSKEMLTFGPEPGVVTGPAYIDRGLRLNLLGGGIYELVLLEALPADQGMYVCTAKEWIQERGRDWQDILSRSVDMGEVQVTPISESLIVAMDGKQTLSVGDTLNLTCSVVADDLSRLGLDISWLVSSESGDSRVVAHVSQDGVVTDSSGLVGVSRVSIGAFRLVVPGVSQTDSGLYSCKVGLWIRRSSGDWYQAAEGSSNSASVLVTMIEPEFKVTLSDVLAPRAAGDPAELECRVTDVSSLQDGRLGVSWQYTEETPADLPTSSRIIATLDEQGNQQPGEEYRDRAENGLLVLTRVIPDTFKLRLLQAQMPDMGQYTCKVSAWTRQRDGGWTKDKEVQSNPVTIAWTQKNPSLEASARVLREASSGGSTFEMSCQVSAENLRDTAYSVLIQMEETPGGKARKIVSLSPDSVLKLEEWDELGRLDSVVLEKIGVAEFRFRLYGAQVSDRGFYSCEVTAWTSGPGNTWAKTISTVSNAVQISFADTGPAFNVSIQPDFTSVLPGQTAKISCVITALGVSPKEGDVSYEVQWYQSGLLSLDQPAPLASMDRWGVVRKSLQDSSTDCSLEQTGAHTFALQIHGAQDRDAGDYHCSATPWLRSASGTWTSGRELTSDRSYLTVTFTLWDTLKMPLLYGIGSSLLVGLLSILLGFVCAQCCCRNTRHTPRNRNGLMDLEMD